VEKEILSENDKRSRQSRLDNSMLQGKDIISINDLSRDEIQFVLDKAQWMKVNHEQPDIRRLAQHKIAALMFFEPSTRTKTSFETAMRHLGGQVGGFHDAKVTSVAKQESLWDTVKMFDAYGFDVLVIRHPLKGSARVAAEATSIPVINAGDGANQHPTQTLLDLYTIRETQGRLENLTIGLVGDLLNGRTIHSLVEAFLKYKNIRLLFISPRDFAMPHYLIDKCQEHGVWFKETSSLNEHIPEMDILYMTRVQVERLEASSVAVEKLKSLYRLEPDMLSEAKSTLKVLHPLPRVTEISKDVDSTQYAYYFEQARNGLYVRMALLTSVMGVWYCYG
jgi:aspartate carbamoyltransferase catalytic subunit